RNYTYVGYTATPFANLLIDPRVVDDDLKYDLYPKDFIISLKAPPEYFGTKELFGLSEDRDASREHPGLAVFREIEDTELGNAKKLVTGRPLRSQCPELRRALHAFILSCAV